jgi:hypothetical protein
MPQVTGTSRILAAAVVVSLAAAVLTLAAEAADTGPSPRVLTRAEGLPSSWVKGLFLEGNDLWISAGTERAGGIAVYRVRTGKLEPFSPGGTFDGKLLFGVARYRGELYLGTDRGVFRGTGGKAVKYAVVGNLSLANAELVADGDRHLYALAKSMYGGLFRYDGAKWEAVSLPQGEGVLNNGTAFAVLGPGDLLISTTGGVVWRYTDGTWKKYGTGDGLPGGWVTSLTAGKDGVYAGAYQGLALFSGGKWSNLGGLVQGNKVSSVKVYKNKVFAGTFDGGVFVISGGKATAITVATGLPDDRVTALAASEESGLVFAGTVNGLAVFSGLE